jgi:hypothetical protein
VVRTACAKSTRGSCSTSIASDCPPTGNECIANVCDAQSCCATQNLDQSHSLSTGQTAHDCQRIVCNGNGGTTTVDDATDLPSTTETCLTSPACTGVPLAPSFSPAPTGTDCSGDGQSPTHVCGDTNSINAGTCVQCNVGADCPAVSDGGAPTCVNNICQ